MLRNDSCVIEDRGVEVGTFIVKGTGRGGGGGGRERRSVFMGVDGYTRWLSMVIDVYKEKVYIIEFMGSLKYHFIFFILNLNLPQGEGNCALLYVQYRQ